MGNRLSESLILTHDQLIKEVPLKRTRDGSTAIVCSISGNRLYTANVGDSRAVLSRGKTAIELSKDHKPDGINNIHPYIYKYLIIVILNKKIQLNKNELKMLEVMLKLLVVVLEFIIQNMEVD